MSRIHSILLALTSRREVETRLMPLSSKEIFNLASSGDFGKILDGHECLDSEVAKKIGVSRIQELLASEPACALTLESLSHKGIWCVSILEDLLDSSLHKSLKESNPVLMYGVGDKSLLTEPSFGVVGSRNVSNLGAEIAYSAGELCASKSHVLVSGGAKGVDQFSMKGAIENGGRAVGFLANGLTQSMRDSVTLSHLHDGSLALVSPYSPSAPFSVGAAMGRNKLIYGASESVLVVATDLEKGGTWAGAVEAVKKNYSTVNVWLANGSGPGNRALLSKGAHGVSEINLAFEVASIANASTEADFIEQLNLF